MSDTILPWICPYLIDVAQVYGASIQDVPLTPKGKKVQLVKFLTYGEESQGTHIWARISDKSHVIPIRFSKDAIQEYNRSSQTPFTRLKTAIITIKYYHPVFRRVPLGGKGGMSAERALTIECQKFQYIGSAGEDVFGSPVSVEKNLDILEWSNGLSKDGGAGNVLRTRKQEELEEAAMSKIQQVESKTCQTLQTAKKTAAVKQPAQPAPAIASANPSRAYEKSWASTRKPQYRRPPPDIAAVLEEMPVRGDPEPETKIITNTPARRKSAKHALDLCTSPTSPPSPRSREASTSPGTMISGWHPSPTQRDPETQTTDLFSSHPSPPTPAQRTKGDDNSLPPSSPPFTSQPPVNETRLQTFRPTVSPPTHARRSVTRKIPRPPQPIPRLSPVGSARILVPNSDTSLSHSQSQSQSQRSKDESSQRPYLSLSQLSQSSIPHDVVVDQVVHTEHETSKDLKKENAHSYSEDMGDKTDDEVDNHSDQDSTHNSLFSGHFSDSDNSCYDGDYSLLEPPGVRGGQTSTASPSQDGCLFVNDTPASMIAHPASSQRQDAESLNISHLEDRNDGQAVNGRPISPFDLVVDKEPQFFNGDDDRIHDDLPKASNSTESQKSRADAPPLGRIGVEEYPEIRTQVQHPRKPHSSTMSENVSKPPSTGDQTAEVSNIKPVIKKSLTSTSSGLQRRKNVVTHDAKAWLAPSFLRPSSSINIDGPSATTSRSATNSKDHSIAFVKRKTPGRTSENATSNNPTPKRQAPSRGDQNSNPLMHVASSTLSIPKQNKSYNNSMKAESYVTRESSQPRKRARDSEHLSQTSSDHAHKKRKMNHSHPESSATGAALEVSSDHNNDIKLLGGWCHGLNQPILLNIPNDIYSPSEEDIVTWDRLKEICLRTGRKRETESL